jgi:general secretion pathway protein B
MSFILDALRRAETERARGAVPGLEARALPLAGDDEPSRAVPKRGPWIVAGLAAGALVLGLAGWWLTRAPADTAAVASTAPPATPSTPASPGTLAPSVPAAPFLPPTTPASPAPTLPSPPAAPQRAATPTVPWQAAPTAVAPAAPLPGVGRVAVDPSRQPAQPLPAASAPRGATASPLASPAGSPAASAAATMTAATVATAPTTATSASGATDVRPLPLAQLSPQQRAELPPMAIGGAIYSESPASRFILVNGQVVREGDLAAPGVTLERIGPRSAVIRWRGLRIEIPQ